MTAAQNTYLADKLELSLGGIHRPLLPGRDAIGLLQVVDDQFCLEGNPLKGEGAPDAVVVAFEEFLRQEGEHVPQVVGGLLGIQAAKLKGHRFKEGEKKGYLLEKRKKERKKERKYPLTGLSWL